MLSPEINLHLHGQLIFEKEAKTCKGAKTVYSTNSIGKIGQIGAKKKKLNQTTFL